MLLMAAEAIEMTGLGYLGADFVLDKERGPVLLELNARPGLAIQIANRSGLRRRLVASGDRGGGWHALGTAPLLLISGGH